MTRFTGFATVHILLTLLFVACSPPLSVEQQIIANIRDMEANIEAGERRPFIEHVAADFSGQDAAVNRDQLNALVLYHLHRHKRLHAQLLPIQVSSAEPDKAEARFRALITGGPGWLPDQGQVYEFATGWQRREDEWLLISARWKPVAMEDILDL